MRSTVAAEKLSTHETTYLGTSQTNKFAVIFPKAAIYFTAEHRYRKKSPPKTIIFFHIYHKWCRSFLLISRDFFFIHSASIAWIEQKICSEKGWRGEMRKVFRSFLLLLYELNWNCWNTLCKRWNQLNISLCGASGSEEDSEVAYKNFLGKRKLEKLAPEGEWHVKNAKRHFKITFYHIVTHSTTFADTLFPSFEVSRKLPNGNVVHRGTEKLFNAKEFPMTISQTFTLILI